MAERLAERGFEVVQSDSGERALELLEQFAFDIVITDLRLPGIDGARVIEAARDRYPSIVAIVITGFGTVKDAVDAIKRGASDFVAKPFQFDELLHVLQNAQEQRRLRSEKAYLRTQLEERYQFGVNLGRRRPMQKLYHILETVARSNRTMVCCPISTSHRPRRKWTHPSPNGITLSAHRNGAGVPALCSCRFSIEAAARLRSLQRKLLRQTVNAGRNCRAR